MICLRDYAAESDQRTFDITSVDNMKVIDSVLVDLALCEDVFYPYFIVCEVAIEYFVCSDYFDIPQMCDCYVSNSRIAAKHRRFDGHT